MSAAESTTGRAYIAGAFEHPTRLATEQSIAQLHAEVARGALLDAGLGIRDVDAYYTADAPGLGPIAIVEHLAINPRIVASTDVAGPSYLLHANHAAPTTAAGHCQHALVI